MIMMMTRTKSRMIVPILKNFRSSEDEQRRQRVAAVGWVEGGIVVRMLDRA
jgi:hypothetical protein